MEPKDTLQPLQRKALDFFSAQMKLKSPSVVHVILMDCQMPEMDGFETTQKIRETTALAGDRKRCLAAGMNDYLAKPLDLKSLRLIPSSPRRTVKLLTFLSMDAYVRWFPASRHPKGSI